MKDSFAFEQRQLERISLPRPILIRSDLLGYADSTAVLRDISAGGAYCYTLMPLAKGDVAELFLTLSDAIGTSHISFTATVVRVEDGITENSVGVGFRFSAFTELNAESSTA
jgi:c-di-GMP-binding flagellar brake protein YcgR